MPTNNISVKREAPHNIADPAIELLLRKNHNYGNSWSRQGLAGVLVHLSDKFYRFQNLSGNTEAMVADEKMEDSLQHALAYCMLGLLYLRTESFEPELEPLVSLLAPGLLSPPRLVQLPGGVTSTATRW